jgi:hypothetical protein
MNKTDYNKRVFSLISILASIFVYTGAILIYFYANGWRLGNTNQLFIKTGVLTVESDPFLANLYIDGKEKGRTPKSVNLPIGIYDVSLYKSGYVEWRKSIEIKEQKSTPIYPWLIKESIKKKQQYLLQGKKYINSWMSEYGTHTYFLTNEYLPENSVYRYTLYRFDINTAFWDMGSNPRTVLTFDSVTEPVVEISLAPNGIVGLLTLVSPESTKYYLLDSSRSSTLDTLSELNISMFSSYEMTWSKNNQYLMFESKDDLISFDITKQTRYLLIKKLPDTEYIWSTDEQGYFYKIQLNTDSQLESVYSYLLIQQQMDGSAPKTIVSDLFFQKDTNYIFPYREDTGNGKYSPFTNSPESTKSVGKILSFTVNQNSKGIYIKTETSSYWYNTTNKKYYLVSPYSSDIVEFAQDNHKLIFKNEKGYSVFTFYKEEGDHTVEIGSKEIKSLETSMSKVSWVSNSLNVWYIKENTMYVADIDGENQVKILQQTDKNIYQTITQSKENIVTLTVGELAENGTRNIEINTYAIY